MGEAYSRGVKVILAVFFLILSFEFDPLLWSISGLGAPIGFFLLGLILLLEIDTAFKIALRQ